MALGQHKRAVGVFSTRREAEIALKELRDSNFVMDRVSVIAQDADQNEKIAGAEVRDEIRDRNDNKADEGATTGALAGGTLGGLTGLLVGLGTLALPGIGPIMLAGATATAIATTIAGGAIGAAAGSLLGALVGLGIPEHEARGYNDRISRGHYLVVIEGTDEEIARAQAILHRGGVEDWRVYDIPDADRTNPNYATAAVAAPVGKTHPTSTHQKRAIGVFAHRRDAEAAMRDLRDARFNMNQISLVGKDAHGNADLAGDLTNQTKTTEGATAGAATGGALGGLGGLLVGLGALAIPGIGPVIAGGALATALATAAAGGAIGAAAGGLTGALAGLGIPDDRARLYNDRVNRGDFLVMVDGTDQEIEIAQAILNRHGIQEWGVFDNTGVATGRTGTGMAAAAAGRTGTGMAATNRDRYHRAVGVFPHRRDAEAAIHELQTSGFNMSQISLVGKDAHGTSTDLTGNVADRTKADEGAATGGALGGLTGALVGLGIPDERAKFYNDRVNRGDYLVMVDGTEAEILQAETILSRRGIQDWAIFDAPDHARTAATTHPNPTTTATRNVIEHEPTSRVHPTGADYEVVDNHPEVVIIDKRDQHP